MNSLRHSQIKDFIENERKIKDIPELNKGILKTVGGEVLDKYIIKKFRQGFSEQDIAQIRFELEKIHGIEIEFDTDIFHFLYNILTQNILLPDYVEGWAEEDVFKELDSIAERVRKKNTRILEQISSE